jgi:hypothetical protein
MNHVQPAGGISGDIRDLTLDLAFRTAHQHGERNTDLVAAGLGAAFYQFLAIYHGPTEARTLAIAIIENLAEDVRH